MTLLIQGADKYCVPIILPLNLFFLPLDTRHPNPDPLTVTQHLTLTIEVKRYLVGEEGFLMNIEEPEGPSASQGLMEIIACDIICIIFQNCM